MSVGILRLSLIGIATLIAGGINARGDEEAAISVPGVYLTPQNLIDIGGRRLNLVCMGQGAVTVVPDAGSGDWSDTWALVQPQVAKYTRACAYDRAGMGFSDPSPESRTTGNLVQDLHTLLERANIRPPLLLVSHSMGGLTVRLYKATYPSEVAGMVLVEPSEPYSSERSRDIIAKQFGAQLAGRFYEWDKKDDVNVLEKYRACAAAAGKKGLDPDSDAYHQCAAQAKPELGADIAAERRLVYGRATFYEMVYSELRHLHPANSAEEAPRAALVMDARVYGSMPLIVLTAGIPWDEEAGSEHDEFGGPAYFAWTQMHEQTATLSTRGIHRIIPGTHHNIQIERPDQVLSAILEILNQSAAARH